MQKMLQDSLYEGASFNFEEADGMSFEKDGSDEEDVYEDWTKLHRQD